MREPRPAPARRRRSPPPLGRRLAAAAALAGLLLAAAGAAEPKTPRLRVGTSGDYAPFSQDGKAGELRGFDVAVARAYAEERGLELEFVRFRWPQLLRDLAADRFDVAMSGVTVRPLRSVAGRFSVPSSRAGRCCCCASPSAGVRSTSSTGPICASA
jgi:cyclohexadienyl dehydratase